MNLWIVLLFLIILLAIALKFPPKKLLNWFRDSLPFCVRAHSQNADNYPWLADIHGGIKSIDWEEPANSGNWRPYDDDVWAIHCKVIKHDPANLVDSHMKAFVNPSTRFARLMFNFADGTSMEPIEEFYIRERDWFAQKKQ